MDDLMLNQYVWAFLGAGLVIGIFVVTKVPELLVAILLVGPEYIQFALRVVGLDVDRRTFATAGAVVFLPIVILFLVTRLLQTREQEPLIGRRNVAFILVAVVLGLDLLLGLVYTDSQWYGSQKTRDYFVFGMAPAFLVFVFLRDRAAAHRFLGWAVVVTISYMVLSSAYSYFTAGTIFYHPPAQPTVGGMSIATHTGLATALVIAMAAIMAMSAGRNEMWWKALPLVSMPIVALYAVLSGARGMVVALAFMGTVGLFWVYKRSRGPLVVGLLLTLITTAGLFLFVPEEARERVFSSWFTTETAAGLSGSERIEMLERIPEHFSRAPVFGSGTGSWPILQAGREEYAWPHNMFAEILVENGIIGLVILLSLWFIVIRRVAHHLHTSEPGTEVYGFAVFGGCLLVVEMTSALAYFGIAHFSCSFLMTSAITMRALSLTEVAETPGGESVHRAEGESAPAVLKAGPL